MTYQPSADLFEVSSIKDEFARLRSEWLDEFAHLEAMVLRFLQQSGKLGDCNPPFAQRLTELSATKANSNVSKKRVEQLGIVAEECRQLLPLRATIVHSAMLVCTSENTSVALFQNVANEVRGDPMCVALSAERFRASIKALRNLGKRMSDAA